VTSLRALPGAHCEVSATRVRIDLTSAALF